MKIRVHKEMFIEKFKKSIYGSNFSTEGLATLFDYLEEFEKDSGIEIEFDIETIACDFEEFTSIKELRKEYYNDILSKDLSDAEYLEKLQDFSNTILHLKNGGIIINSF